MKKRFLILATLILTLATLFCVAAFTVSAEEAEPSVEIAKFNLAFENNTYLKYAVRFDGVADERITENNIGMLYWTDYEDGFVPGTENYSSATTGYTEIDGVKNYIHATATPKTDGSTGFTKAIGFATETDTVLAYDSELATFFVQISGEKFGIGTYGTYDTISISESKHFTAEKINVKEGQFPMSFMRI